MTAAASWTPSGQGRFGAYGWGMLAPPADLTDEIVLDALARGWALTTACLAYQPVGWGSHHWRITDDGGASWFVTADDLRGRRDGHEPAVDPAYDRLRSSLASAVALKDAGRTFVAAHREAGVTLPAVRPIAFPDAAWYRPTLEAAAGW